MSENSMEIEYHLTPKDMQALRRYSVQLSKKNPANTLLFTGALLLPFLVAYLLIPTGLLDRDLLYAFGIGGVFGSCCLLFFLLAKARRMTGQFDSNEHNQWLFGTFRMRFSPESVTVVGDHRTTTEHWPIVWHIGRTAEHVFFLITTTNAHVVPRRAFRDNEHFKEFLALAREYQRGLESDEIMDALPAPSTDITRPSRQ